MEIGFINGNFIDITEPVIPIQERGHQFGDGVYEVVRVYQSVPFLLDEHLQRLSRSAKAIQLKLPYSLTEMKKIILEGISRSQLKEAEVYFQITRGIAGRNHLFPSVSPSFTMTIRPIRAVASEYYEIGAKVITAEDVRWANCYIKSLNLLPNILAKQTATNEGSFEAVFMKENYITEGSSTNVFIIKDNVLYTTPEHRGILSGITRQTIINLALQNNIEIREEFCTLDFFKNADEAFLTSTLIEVLPIKQIDDYKLANEVPGPVTRLLHASYQAYCNREISKV